MVHAQTITSWSVNAGSLGGPTESGSISSTIGEFVVGVLGDEEGSVSQGFSQSYVDANTPVQLLAVARAAQSSWTALLATGTEIQICNLNGSVVMRLPQGLGHSQVQSALRELSPAVYVIRSGSGPQQVRMIFSPSIR